MPTPTKAETPVAIKPASADAATINTSATKSYRIKRGVWNLVDAETGERDTFVAGNIIELTADEYERNKRNVEPV